MAQALGGTVSRSPQPELGWYEISSTQPDFIPAGPWFEWHSDRWTLPPGAVELARNQAASQAFVLGRALALQFHPELDDGLLELCIADDHDGEQLARMGCTAAQLREATAAQRPYAIQRLRTLVTGFLQRVAAPAGQP